MDRKPTAKQIAFVKDVQETFSPTRSAERIYKTKNKHIANSKGRQLMQSPNVRAMMDELGISDKALFERLKKALRASRLVWSRTKGEWLEEVDWPTQIKALELAMKLKGWLSNKALEGDTPESKEINVTFNLVNARDTNEVKKLLTGTPSMAKVRDVILEKPEEKIKEEEIKTAVEGELVNDSDGE